jgi:membrane peptidoglycan carboxypeptidase
MYSEAIAASIGVGDRMHFAIADAHILGALQPYDLLGYRMSVMYFATGVIGARDGARRLFNKSLEELSLSQVAELLSAEADFPDWAVCKNPSKLRLWRDSIIDRMEAFRSIDADEAKAARARPVTCSLKP